jgi:DNA invertase Pin-like site-specific DNA recombinase
MIVGYARVSADGQSLDAQRETLTAAGSTKIFKETVSGAVTDRKSLAKGLDALKGGDTLIVYRLDRPARSTRDLLNVLDKVTKAKATFKSLADAWADTTTSHGAALVTVLAELASSAT